MMALMVFHGTSNVLENILYPIPSDSEFCYFVSSLWTRRFSSWMKPKRCQENPIEKADLYLEFFRTFQYEFESNVFIWVAE